MTRTVPPGRSRSRPISGDRTVAARRDGGEDAPLPRILHRPPRPRRTTLKAGVSGPVDGSTLLGRLQPSEPTAGKPARVRATLSTGPNRPPLLSDNLAFAALRPTHRRTFAAGNTSGVRSDAIIRPIRSTSAADARRRLKAGAPPFHAAFKAPFEADPPGSRDSSFKCPAPPPGQNQVSKPPPH